ncbi:uncharacterized protein [Triticum aestivum]|uniref:uncharacterized protein n=1 Tax=Triticum aestivum TaxID=4565 RepID=UPI001D01C03C|nr:uncharacterized protein LOC123067891 [Triticum aestivum]
MAAAAPPPATALEQLSKTKMFGGQNLRFRHQSATLGCPMTFSIFLPASPASTLPVRALPRSPRDRTPRPWPGDQTTLSWVWCRCSTGSPASPALTRTSSSNRRLLLDVHSKSPGLHLFQKDRFRRFHSVWTAMSDYE